MGTTQVASKTARDIAAATTAFLAALRSEERARAEFDFGDRERVTWHYTPVPRNGLPRGDMDGMQLEAAEELMAVSLSVAGLEKARAIIEHELVLGGIDRSEGSMRFDRNPDLYFFSVFGVPGGDVPWGWQVDGHHLSLNFTVVDRDIIATTPSFIGANPAEVLEGPYKGLRILKKEEDVARELLLSLDARQRAQATIYPVTPPDIITRASPRAELSERTGLPADRMSARQKGLLMSLIRVYIDRKPADVAGNALKKVESEGIDNIYFGWAGSERARQPHYYRIHGPSFLVEYDNIQNMANHIHSVWRDIEGDFGYDILRAHYERHHRGGG